MAYDAGEVEEHARIKVRIDGNLVADDRGASPVGGNSCRRDDAVRRGNQVMTKKEMTKLIDTGLSAGGSSRNGHAVDKIKDLGFSYATRAGISICIDNMHIPMKKEELINEAQREVNEIEKQYSEGLITNGERYNKVIDIWAHVTEQVANEMMKELSLGADGGTKRSVQSDFHDGRFRGARKLATDPAARGHARADGQAIRRNH